jgi:Ni2+-binding GTPase involved in maturation of urease and hydrogenase
MASPRSIQAFLRRQKCCFLNKIDLSAAGHVEFDTEPAEADACRPNRSREIFPISVKAGRGTANWYHWPGRSVRADLLEPQNAYYFSCDR